MSVPTEFPRKLLFLHYDKTANEIVEPVNLSSTLTGGSLIAQQTLNFVVAAGSAIVGSSTNFTMSRSAQNELK